MNAVIDIGNTRTKIGIFESDKMQRMDIVEEIDSDYLDSLLKENKTIHVCISAVRAFNRELLENFSEDGLFIKLDHSIPLPIVNRYKTPETLGNDRLAGIIGAYEHYGKGNLLVIDAGTCIKFDYLNEEIEYLGGAISPGLRMRFEALHSFTGKLPLIEAKEGHIELIGNSTENSILSGVIRGMLAEIEHIISLYENKYPGIRVYMTGGDLGFFDTILKSKIFAAPYLVLEGLNSILNFNLRETT